MNSRGASWTCAPVRWLFVLVRIQSQRFFILIFDSLCKLQISMHPFATYVLRSYYKATGWNEDNLYANLTRASHGRSKSCFCPDRLLNPSLGLQLYLISPFRVVSISPSPNPRMLYSERHMLWTPCRRCMGLSATSSRRVSSTSRTHATCN